MSSSIFNIPSFKSLERELAAIDPEEIKAPKNFLRPGAKIIGTLEDQTIRRLHTLICKKYQRLNQLEIQNQECETGEEIILRQEIMALQFIFFDSVRALFPALANKPHIGVSRGWAVTINNPRTVFPKGYFEKMFNGDPEKVIICQEPSS